MANCQGTSIYQVDMCIYVQETVVVIAIKLKCLADAKVPASIQVASVSYSHKKKTINRNVVKLHKKLQAQVVPLCSSVRVVIERNVLMYN